MNAAAAVVLLGCWWLATAVGSGAAAGCLNLTVPGTNAQVQHVVNLTQQTFNRNAPFAANVTAILFACRQAINGGFNFNVTFNVTNTTCSPATKDKRNCCLFGEPKTCNASATCDGSLNCTVKKVSCKAVAAPRPGCTGCFVPQTNLALYSAVFKTAMQLFAQRNSGINANSAKLVAVSTQLVSGTNYNFTSTVLIQNTTQYFNGDTLHDCDARLPSACLRPINYSALTERNHSTLQSCTVQTRVDKYNTTSECDMQHVQKEISVCFERLAPPAKMRT